jgi:hypothetical protein
MLGERETLRVHSSKELKETLKRLDAYSYDLREAYLLDEHFKA